MFNSPVSIVEDVSAPTVPPGGPIAAQTLTGNEVKLFHSSSTKLITSHHVIYTNTETHCQ